MYENMAGAQGVEPQPHEPESCVLPLDNAPSLVLPSGLIIGFGIKGVKVKLWLKINSNQSSTQILCRFAIWN